MMSSGFVYFAHGMDSHPWGTKISHLANVANINGYKVESIDFTFTKDPQKRVEHILNFTIQKNNRLIFVGSSMGAYVMAVASQYFQPTGLFLMAPAFYMARYPQEDPKPIARLTTVIHGWQDDVVPVEHSIRYAQKYDCDLHILKAGHQLTEALNDIEHIFDRFLKRLFEL